MELILTPVVNFGEVRSAQLAKSILLTSSRCPWVLFRSFEVCSDAKESGVRKATGSYRICNSLEKQQTWHDESFNSKRLMMYIIPHSDIREEDTGEGDIIQSKQQKKRRLRIRAYNVKTLLQAGNLENLKEEMRRNKVDVMGISEVSQEQNGELVSDEFRMFNSSGDAKGNHGVGEVLGPCLRDKVISVRYEDNQ